MILIDFTLDEHVAVVTMKNGENWLDPPFITEFIDVLDRVEQETGAQSLIVTSSHEKIFSNGLDLDSLLPAFRSKDTEAVKDYFVLINRLLKRILLYPMVTIAVISGHAFAGGAVLACAFDFRFMRLDRGYFCLPEIDLGIPFLPGMDAILKKAIPVYKLEEMQYTGKRLTAYECKQHHIVTEICDQTELLKRALEYAKSLKKGRSVMGEMKARKYQDIIYAMDHDDNVCIESENFHIHWIEYDRRTDQRGF